MKVSFHIPQNLAEALDEFVAKTGEEKSMVIRLALEKYVINCAHETIPELSSKVKLEKMNRDKRLYSQVMTNVKSAGWGTHNLNQTIKDIEGMPISDAEKRDTVAFATKYNEFQKMYRRSASPLLDTALPELRRKKSAIEFLWTQEFCEGCDYIRIDEAFCNENCKKLNRMRRAMKGESVGEK